MRYFLNPSPSPFKLDPSVTPGLSLFRLLLGGCLLSTVDCPLLSHSGVELLALLQLSGLLKGEGPSLNLGTFPAGEYTEDVDSLEDELLSLLELFMEL